MKTENISGAEKEVKMWIFQKHEFDEIKWKSQVHEAWQAPWTLIWKH